MVKPTLTESGWLKRIAQHGPLMKTYENDKKNPKLQVYYSLAGGELVPTLMAERLIGGGFLVPQKDGMFDDCQSWAAKRP